MHYKGRSWYSEKSKKEHNTLERYISNCIASLIVIFKYIFSYLVNWKLNLNCWRRTFGQRKNVGLVTAVYGPGWELHGFLLLGAVDCTHWHTCAHTALLSLWVNLNNLFHKMLFWVYQAKYLVLWDLQVGWKWPRYHSTAWIWLKSNPMDASQCSSAEMRICQVFGRGAASVPTAFPWSLSDTYNYTPGAGSGDHLCWVDTTKRVPKGKSRPCECMG